MADPCMACPLPATHTLRWVPIRRAWQARRLCGLVDRQRTIHRYCLEHATARAERRNALGILPAMAQLRRVLARQEQQLTQQGRE